MRPQLYYLVGALVTSILLTPSRLPAQGTAFTYQGRLNDGANPANGNYDFRFRLATDALANNYAGGNVLTNGVPISNGLFTVTLDFGSEFNGSNYWLEIGVRTNNGSGYSTLNPLQPLTSVPYAVFAASASSVLGVIPSAGLGGSYSGAVSFSNPADVFIGNYSGNGGGLTNVNAAALGGIGADQLWKTIGNSNTIAGASYLGTSDNQPLEIKVNGIRALRIEPNTNGAPNMIGGAPINFVDAGIVGATIGGGGSVSGNFYLGNGSNHVSAIFGTIGGGRLNTVGADHAFIGGGISNSVRLFAYDGVIGGGVLNTIQTNASESVLVGGLNNTIQPFAGSSFLGGGYGNTIQYDAYYSVLGGGELNSIQTNDYYGFIGGGYNNSIQSNAPYGVLGGGYNNTIRYGNYATIGGGFLNLAGNASTLTGNYSSVGGGYANNAEGNYATASGGNLNWARGDYSFAAGRQAKANSQGDFVWADSQAADFNSTAADQFSVRAAGGARFITSGAGMTVDGPVQAASFQGVGANLSGLNASGISSGTLADARLSGNVPLLNASLNTFAGDLSLAGGASYHHLQLSGGNSIGYLYGSYPAFNDGIHLGYNFYADASGGPHLIATDGATSRLTAGYGFVGIYVGGVGAPPTTTRLIADTAGVTVYGTFNNFSDRNAKQDFAPVSASHILAKVAQLPVSEWSYKEDPNTRHVGPMAQDFYSAFNIGTDDKHIAPIDEGGVALAAIQGLNQKLEAGSQRSEDRMQRLEVENAELKARLEKLERLIDSTGDVAR
jgi:trimeric autotransporter adhesin